jgi:hypothetical protein
MRGIIPGLIFVCLAFPAFAQEEDASDPICQVSPNWRVLATELSDTPGMTMDVNKRDASGKPDCKTKDLKPDFTIGGPDQALWFTFLAPDYLIMSRSTGPVSNVVVEKLDDKSIALDVTSNDTQTDSWGVTYWEQKEPATAENCDDFASWTSEGFKVVMTHEMRFDFATKTSLSSGKVMCEVQE